MTILHNLSDAKLKSESVITIGVFDGVHLGHQSLFKHLILTAQKNGWHSIVLTFKSHPETIINPKKQLPLLDDINLRVKRIESIGIEIVVALDFTPKLRELNIEDFILLLRDQLNMRRLIVGPDFAMGKDRQGNIEKLRLLGSQMDFSVESVPSLILNRETVSSSLIRQALNAGNINKVTQLLGRYFSYNGQVVTGDQRGRSLGFPTANMDIIPGLALPPDGVYATLAYVNNRAFPAVTNIGVRPTFESTKHLIETHLIDTRKELIDKKLRIDFVEKLRDEQHFGSIEQLKKQIEKDVDLARSHLAKLV